MQPRSLPKGTILLVSTKNRELWARSEDELVLITAAALEIGRTRTTKPGPGFSGFSRALTCWLWGRYWMT